MSDWIFMKSTWSAPPSPSTPSAPPAPVRGRLAERAAGGVAEADAVEPRSWIFMPSTPKAPEPQAGTPFTWGGGGAQRSGSVTRSSTFGDGRGSHESSYSHTTWGPDGQVHQSGSRTTVSRLTSPWGSDTYRIREEWKDGELRRSGSRVNTSTFSSPWGSETYRYRESW